MNLLEKINKDYKESLLKRDIQTSSVLKLLRAAILNMEIELRGKKKELEEKDVVQVLKREIKKRKEAIVFYEKGGRQDLALKEKEELNILEKYLPLELSEEEIKKIIQKKIEELTPEINFGKIMKEVMKEIKDQADGAKVAELVKRELEKK